MSLNGAHKTSAQFMSLSQRIQCMYERVNSSSNKCEKQGYN